MIDKKVQSGRAPKRLKRPDVKDTVDVDKVWCGVIKGCFSELFNAIADLNLDDVLRDERRWNKKRKPPFGKKRKARY